MRRIINPIANGKRGAALILILGILAALGWLAAEIVRETVRQQSESAAYTRAQRMRETAWSATECLIAGLREKQLVDGGLHHLPARPDVLLTEAGFVPPRGLTVTVELSDESGKLGFRKMTADTLRELLIDVGVPSDAAPRLADTTLDRFEPGESRRLLGMKREDYLAAGLPAPPERPPEHFAELLQTPGFTEYFTDSEGKPNSGFRSLCSCLSLSGDTDSPNLNTASAALLHHWRRLGKLADGDALLRWRHGPDGIANTDDDRYARTSADMTVSGAGLMAEDAAFTVRRLRILTKVSFGESSFLLCVLADPTTPANGFPWKILFAEENRRID